MRSKEQIEICLQSAQEDFIPQEDIDAAVQVLHEIVEMEIRSAAEHNLQTACSHAEPEEIRRAMLHAKEVGVAEDVIAAADECLKKILAELARRENAKMRLRELVKSEGDSLSARLAELEAALQLAQSCGVPHADIQEAEELLEVLRGARRREMAKEAVAAALAAQELQAAKQAYTAAKQAGVPETELVSFQQQLRDLADALELANDKEKLLERRVAGAMAAKRQAEQMESSAEVEKMMGEGGVILVLKDAIQEAKTTRLVKKAAIAKAEAVLPEIVADLKRMIEDKKIQEKRLAEESLRADVELVREAGMLNAAVLDGLRTSIAEAQRFNADVRDAEQLLTQLSNQLEKKTAETKELLDEAFQQKDPPRLRQGLAACQQLLLDQEHTDSVIRLRSLTEEDILLARSEHDREARLAMVAKLEQYVNILRENGDKQLRGFHNDLQDLKGALRVFCRVRPLNGREKKKEDTIAVEVVDPFTVSVTRDDHDAQEFAYDAIFGPNSTQAEVFAECKGMVQSMVDGYNVTVFTYGQTGAGKTWTLYGSGSEPGLSPRLCEEIFRVTHRDREKFDFAIRASMVELYLADLRDLLSKNKEPPKLDFKPYRQADGSIGQRLEGVTELAVANSEDLAKVVAMGLDNRKVRSTKMNASSSRSHLMLIISMDVTDKETRRQRFGKISIVDLAGCERLDKSGVTGE
ncbi:unnamed protein product, partial [Effrenium voratum]